MVKYVQVHDTSAHKVLFYVKQLSNTGTYLTNAKVDRKLRQKSSHTKYFIAGISNSKAMHGPHWEGKSLSGPQLEVKKVPQAAAFKRKKLKGNILNS